MLYRYKCRSCSHEFDVTQSIKDDPLVDCPECRAPELQKVIFASRLGFKAGTIFGNKKSM